MNFSMHAKRPDWVKEAEDELAAQWKLYIQYLHDWADTHSGVEYANMSPVCFDEWVDNEYTELYNEVDDYE